MVEKFKPTGLSLEVLLELVRTSDAKKVNFEFNSNDHSLAVMRWLQSCGIKAGNVPNPATPLYENFAIWAKANNEPIPKIAPFGTLLTKMFPKGRNHDGYRYLLNKKVEHEKEETSLGNQE